MHLNDDCHIVATNAALVLVNKMGLVILLGSSWILITCLKLLATERILKAI